MWSKITPGNKSTLIGIAALLLFVGFIVAFFVRTVVKATRGLPLFRLDDILLAVASGFGTVQTVLTVVQAYNGLGQPQHAVYPGRLDHIMRMGLASNIFYVYAIGFAKASQIALVHSLTPNRKHRQTVIAFSGVLGAWTLISTFVAIFQCGAHRPWDYLQLGCIDRAAWWSVFDVLNAVTEALLIILPVYFVWNVQWPWQRKVLFSIPFAFRVCTIVACVVDISLWEGSVSGSPDPFFEGWKTTVSAQIIQCCCISSISILYLKGFLGLVESGFGLDEDLRTTAPAELRTIMVRPTSRDGLAHSASLPGSSSKSGFGSGN